MFRKFKQFCFVSPNRLQGNEAANVTGVGGGPVKGSQYAAEKRPYPRRGGGGYFNRGGRRGNSRRRFVRREPKEEGGFEANPDNGIDKPTQQDQIGADRDRDSRPRRMPRRGGYFRRGYYRSRVSYPRRPRGPPPDVGDERNENFENNNYGPDGPQGGQDMARPKRFQRRFWSRRPRRPRSDTEGSLSGAEGDASGVSLP